MNVELVEKKITKKTKAIVPVHFSGYMTIMPKLMRISKNYKIQISFTNFIDLLLSDKCPRKSLYALSHRQK